VSPQDFSPAPYPFYAESGPVDAPPLPEAAPREWYWLYILLFTLTLGTTTVVGTAMQMDFERNLPFDIERSLNLYAWAWHHPAILLQGLPFSLTLLAILTAHEFGHYLAAAYHRVDASLPYFMPSPFMGTFGAFIRVRSAICNKRQLFDIGVAGPLAGFVFLLPAFAVGLAFSKVIPNIAHQGDIQFGVPTLQWLLQSVIFPGTRTVDIYLHPVARALGGSLRYRHEPAAHRTVGWRPHPVRFLPPLAQAGIDLHVRGAAGVGRGAAGVRNRLVWLDRVGGNSLLSGPQASYGLRFLETRRGSPQAGVDCPGGFHPLLRLRAYHRRRTMSRP
jgi:hypothetical protein